MAVPQFPDLERMLVAAFGPVLGIFLHQLCYWFRKMAGRDSVYIPPPMMKDQRGMSRRHQDAARKEGAKKGVLEEWRGAHNHVHFRVDWVRLAECLDLEFMLYAENGENPACSSGKPAEKGVQVEVAQPENARDPRKQAENLSGKGPEAEQVNLHAQNRENRLYLSGKPAEEGEQAHTGEYSAAYRQEIPPNPPEGAARPSKDKRRNGDTRRDTRRKRATQKTATDDLSWLFDHPELEDETLTDKRHASSARDSGQEAAFEEVGSETLSDHEAPRSEETPKARGDEPAFGWEDLKAGVLGRPALTTTVPQALNSGERSEVAKLVYRDAFGGSPKTVPGRFALACVRGERMEGGPITPLLVAEKVREALASRHAVEAFLSTVEGELEELRAGLLEEVAV